MVDMLCEMPGYQAAQTWFIQAIPALNKYVRLNQSLSVNVRFKVEAPTNSLSCENDGNAAYYLGFDEQKGVTPRLMGRRTVFDVRFWDRIDIAMEETKVLFSPATYRGPTLHGFKNFAVGDDFFGAKYNSAFTATQWELISPFGVEMPGGSPYELKNMSRVILRTVPFQDPATKAQPDKVHPSPCHMTVFRNAQGAFLPAISDNDEYQYWRIQKVDSTIPGEPIKGNDSIRLCWRFSDQTAGFRDYADDVFGRRRNQCPPELESTTLYLKVPWPRFEIRNTPTAMVMSAKSDTHDVAEAINVLPGKFEYVLQDLKLRIDTVENQGRGDSSDFMLRGLTQGKDTVDMVVRSAKDPLHVWQRIGSFGVV
ncbi:hypothetical protein NX059_011321 [Plenodomus lindquistii]|nr:hypothetical protein NX059_011321 [Plenodomus lindquistii]